MEVARSLQTPTGNFLLPQVFKKESDVTASVLSQLPVGKVFELRTLCKGVREAIDNNDPLWRRICQVYFSEQPGVVASQQRCSSWKAEFCRLDDEYGRPIRRLRIRFASCGGGAQDYYPEVRSLATRAVEKGLEGVLHSCARLLKSLDPSFQIAWPLLELSPSSPDALINVALAHDYPHIVWEIIRLRNPSEVEGEIRDDGRRAWVNHAESQKAIRLLARVNIYPTADEISAAIQAGTLSPDQLAWIVDSGICQRVKYAQNGLSLVSCVVRLDKFDHLKRLIPGRWSVLDLNKPVLAPGWQTASTPLHVAAYFGADERIVRHLVVTARGLLNARNRSGETAIYIATAFQQLGAVRVLAELKADCNVQNLQFLAPLHLAVMDGNKPIAKALFTGGADPNGRAAGNWSSLHFATQSLNTKMVKLLLRWGALPNVADDVGQTPLYFAAGGGSNNHLIIARLLLEPTLSPNDQANPNHKAINGLTPFHVAVMSGQLNIVELLWQSNRVDLTIRTAAGTSPRQLAESTHSQALIALFDRIDPQSSSN